MSSGGKKGKSGYYYNYLFCKITEKVEKHCLQIHIRKLLKSPKAIEALEKKLQNDFWVRRLKRREGQKVTIVICVNFSGETSDILDERKPFSGVGRELIIIHTVETVNL